MSAHATSTPSGDAAEARAIKRAGLAHAAVSATKSLHGHTLGGAGGVEAAASLLPLVRGIVPPTLNLVEPDDGCGLDHVMGDGAARCRRARVALEQLRLRRPQRRARARQGVTNVAAERTIVPSTSRVWHASA